MANKRHQFELNWPIPNDFMVELGRVTALWCSLESGMLVSISSLMGYGKVLDERAVISLAHTTFQQRINKFASLCELMMDDFPNLKGYEKVVKKLEAAQKTRNKYSHNAIFFDEKTSKLNVSTYSARGKFKLSTEVVELNDIKETAAKIHEATCELHSLISNKELKPLWERE